MKVLNIMKFKEDVIFRKNDKYISLTCSNVDSLSSNLFKNEKHR